MKEFKEKNIKLYLTHHSLMSYSYPVTFLRKSLIISMSDILMDVMEFNIAQEPAGWIKIPPYIT